MFHPSQVWKVSLTSPLFYLVLPFQLLHHPLFPLNVLTKLIRDCSHLGFGDSGLVPTLTRDRHSFSPGYLRKGRGIEHFQGWLGWHREQAPWYPVTLSAASPFLFGGWHYRRRFRSEGWALGCRCHPARAEGVAPSDGLHVSKARSWAAASFAATASHIFPQDDLDYPCHERLGSSWGVQNLIPLPPTSRIAYPLDVVGGSGLIRYVTRLQGRFNPSLDAHLKMTLM